MSVNGSTSDVPAGDCSESLPPRNSEIEGASTPRNGEAIVSESANQTASPAPAPGDKSATKSLLTIPEFLKLLNGDSLEWLDETDLHFAVFAGVSDKTGRGFIVRHQQLLPAALNGNHFLMALEIVSDGLRQLDRSIATKLSSTFAPKKESPVNEYESTADPFSEPGDLANEAFFRNGKPEPI